MKSKLKGLRLHKIRKVVIGVRATLSRKKIVTSEQAQKKR